MIPLRSALLCGPHVDKSPYPKLARYPGGCLIAYLTVPLYNSGSPAKHTMSLLVIATALCYAAALGGYAVFLSTSNKNAGRLASVLVAGGLLLHYLALLERSRWEHNVPYNDLYGSLSLFAWLLAATYLGLEVFHRQRSVGALVMPVVLIVFGLSVARTPAAPVTLPAGGPLLALHITLNVLGYAAFALSFVLSVIYLIQNRLLRHHRLRSLVWRFPALEVLDRMSRSSVAIGLVSLVVGVGFGLMWFNRLQGTYWTGDPKEIITLVILAVYAGYLWLGRSATWRGARASVLCVVNFLVVLFSYSVVNLYLSGFHRFF
jgi:ABC-type transport system involved in cytochrome c biogenesis permease subunit